MDRKKIAVIAFVGLLTLTLLSGCNKNTIPLKRVSSNVIVGGPIIAPNIMLSK